MMRKPVRTLPQITFECECGTTHNTGDGRLPVGWTTCRGMTWCSDCTRLGIPVRTSRATARGARARRERV